VQCRAVAIDQRGEHLGCGVLTGRAEALGGVGVSALSFAQQLDVVLDPVFFAAATDPCFLDPLLQLGAQVLEVSHAGGPLEDVVGVAVAVFDRVEQGARVGGQQRVGGFAGELGAGDQHVVAEIGPELLGSRGVGGGLGQCGGHAGGQRRRGGEA